MTLPLISCLMVTQAGRLQMFQAAVQDFLNQTHEPKELVIVTSCSVGSMRAYADFVHKLQAPNVRWHQLPHKNHQQAPLGVMRNKTNDLATGEFCCTWDDDDRHHPLRLQRHYEAIVTQGADLSYLNQQLHYFVNLRQLYWIDWGVKRCPGILMYRKTDKRYPVNGSQSHRGEDTVFIADMINGGQKPCAVLDESPLYLRQFHGANTWHYAHHITLARRSVLSEELTHARRPILEAALDRYQLGSPIHVYSQAGLAYDL